MVKLTSNLVALNIIKKYRMYQRRKRKKHYTKKLARDFQRIAYLNKGFLEDADRFNLLTIEKEDKKHSRFFEVSIVGHVMKFVFQFCLFVLLIIYYVTCCLGLFFRRMKKGFVFTKAAPSLKLYSNKYHSGESLI